MTTTTRQDRRMVRAGTVKEGDVIGGQVVTGLGRTWTLDSEDNCTIGAHPSERVVVQYAYLASNTDALRTELEALEAEYWANGNKVRRRLQPRIDALEAQIAALTA